MTSKRTTHTKAQLTAQVDGFLWNIRWELRHCVGSLGGILTHSDAFERALVTRHLANVLRRTLDEPIHGEALPAVVALRDLALEVIKLCGHAVDAAMEPIRANAVAARSIAAGSPAPG